MDDPRGSHPGYCCEAGARSASSNPKLSTPCPWHGEQPAPAAADAALTCDASLVSERGKVLFECDKREGHEGAHTDKGQRWTTRIAAPDDALGDSCGATVVDLLAKTRTCSLPAGHVGDHVADGHVYWAQADAALAVLAELVAAIEDWTHPTPRVRAATARARALVDGQGEAGT